MFNKIFASLAAVLFAVTSANNVVLINPKSSDSGTPIAVVWIIGEGYNSQQYTEIAQAFQAEAKSYGLKAWIAIPDLSYSKAKSGYIDSYVKQAVQLVQSTGFTGENMFLAGHSLGGVMTQEYMTQKKPDYTFKGQMLLGSVMMRQYRSISDDGTTIFNFPADTLTIGGTKDGLTRITRVAEAYWHQVKNINTSQKDMFPIVALDGASHAQFASGDAPKDVLDNDFNPEISHSSAQSSITKFMTLFTRKMVNGKSFGYGDTDSLLAPLIKAIEMEGSYIMKDACYSSDDVNPPSNTCLHGSPWVAEHAVNILVGSFDNSKISIAVDDNFHRTSTVYPYHHPHITQDCANSGSNSCVIQSVSNTMLIYDDLKENKNVRTAISAKDMRAKMKSAQAYQIAAGMDVDHKEDFQRLDEQGDECQRINQAAFDWALSNSSKKARNHYQSVGEPMVMVADTIQENGGLWIEEGLKLKEAKDKSEMDVSGVGCPISQDNLVEMFQGMHYCKLLSPFRAMEWIYVDSLYKNDGISSSQTSLFLQ